jgi:hypothetical protein
VDGCASKPGSLKLHLKASFDFQKKPMKSPIAENKFGGLWTWPKTTRKKRAIRLQV